MKERIMSTLQDESLDLEANTLINPTEQEGNSENENIQIPFGSKSSMSSQDHTKVDVKKVIVKTPEASDVSDDDSENKPMPLYKDDFTLMDTISGYLKASTYQVSVGDDKRHKRKLNGWIGVYLPTLQHIFGVIMFLRLYWIIGQAGFIAGFFLVFMCCLCTFITSVSMSAIATNGKVESGGSYFMLSRNLGPQFGSAVGLLFYLANAVATAMYLVGTIEILLTYVAPGLPQFRSGADGHITHNDMYNNFRIYASILLFVVFCLVAMGIKFVQLFAPITLACVLISIVTVYIGAFVRSPERSEKVCFLGDRLLKQTFYKINGTLACNKTILFNEYCVGNKTKFCDDFFLQNDVEWIAAMPGFLSGIVKENLWPTFMQKGETAPGVVGVPGRDISQDITTSFFILLAIYFPSVTGIMTGSNMSGDLRDPQKDIPRFTIAAQLTTTVVYLSFAIFFGTTVKRQVLWDKYGVSMDGGLVVAELCWPHRWVLLIGSLTSTFGAGLQCLCSAPRLLHSIAKDDVIPFLAIFKPITRFGEPLRALLISYFFAECTVLLGNVDVIAPIVDFFFLMCYAFVNLACALQSILNSPNWRPRYKYYHWLLALLGAAISFFIMFATYWYYALITLGLCAAIYKYVEYRGAKKEWGDGIRGLKLTSAKYSLLNIEEIQHTKNWRPQILILMKLTPDLYVKYPKLLSFARQLKGGQGLVIVASLIKGDYADKDVRQKAVKVKENMKATMKSFKMRGFVQVIVCQDTNEGVSTLIQSTGLGALKPNTVVVGWPHHIEDCNETRIDFLDAVHRVATADVCLMIPRYIDDYPSNICRNTIDVWWIMNDGGLLMILPVLLKRNKIWSRCAVRVFTVATQWDNSVKMRESLTKWLYDLRINATVEVVELPTSDAISAYLQKKTELIEERERLLEKVHLNPKDLTEPQALLDGIRKESVSNLNPAALKKLENYNDFTFSPTTLAQLKGAMEMSNSGKSRKGKDSPDDVKKMHNAVELNMLIKQKSSQADLVILNLPGPPQSKKSMDNYLNYLDVLSEGLPRIMLVRGSGKEVITIYS